MENNTVSMGYVGKNIIVGVIWLVIGYLIITTQTSQMVLAMLFSLFVLNFSENLTDKYIINHAKWKKILSVFLSITILTTVITGLYFSFKLMANDLNLLIQESHPKIISILQKYNYDLNSMNEIYDYIYIFFKENLNFITGGVGLLIKVSIGIIFGLIFHFSKVTEKENNTLEGKVMNDLLYYSEKIFISFKNIISIQILIALMNTTIISIMALGITYVWTYIISNGQEAMFLPYWYIVIPITFVLSLVPVVGNILINLILIMSTVQISPTFVVFGLLLFLIIHKLELIVIGKKMNEKVNVPFSFIIISMALGEMLFHSMSGMLLGMVILLTFSLITKEIKYDDKNSPKYLKK